MVVARRVRFDGWWCHGSGLEPCPLINVLRPENLGKAQTFFAQVQGPKQQPAKSNTKSTHTLSLSLPLAPNPPSSSRPPPASAPLPAMATVDVAALSQLLQASLDPRQNKQGACPVFTSPAIL
jgi:hypothetical protein